MKTNVKIGRPPRSKPCERVELRLDRDMVERARRIADREGARTVQEWFTSVLVRATRSQAPTAEILPAVRLGSHKGLDFVMVWSSLAPPNVHVDMGARHAVVDVATGLVTRSCLPDSKVSIAEHWVQKRKGALLSRWDRIGSRA